MYPLQNMKWLKWDNSSNGGAVSLFVPLLRREIYVLTESPTPLNIEKKEQPEANLNPIEQQIVSILDEYIKPAVASDGGNIVFDSYDETEKSVHVVLQGACSGCPSSTFTLKNGIENMLKEMMPGKISTVVAVNG